VSHLIHATIGTLANNFVQKIILNDFTLFDLNEIFEVHILFWIALTPSSERISLLALHTVLYLAGVSHLMQELL
jgi:hypothetical protein